jgi:hypothetical protein
MTCHELTQKIILLHKLNPQLSREKLILADCCQCKFFWFGSCLNNDPKLLVYPVQTRDVIYRSEAPDDIHRNFRTYCVGHLDDATAWSKRD